MRDSKNNMIIGYTFNEFCVALPFPLPGLWCSAAGTVTVVAGNGMNDWGSAVFADADVVSEIPGLAVHNAECSFAFFLGEI